MKNMPICADFTPNCTKPYKHLSPDWHSLAKLTHFDFRFKILMFRIDNHNLHTHKYLYKIV